MRMAVEIERKFLVVGDGWQAESAGSTPIRQGYLARSASAIVRLRIAGDEAFVTIKGKTDGLTRPEFEYAIPVADAEDLLKLCEDGVIEKVRHDVPVDAAPWTVDVFSGDNAGLVFAEVECPSEEAAEAVLLPSWLGREVSHDRRFDNASLSRRPFVQWSDEEKAEFGL
ncbi:CYTH domain-containing protein [Rhizobiales bacterium Sp-1]|uniref:CYTH domain-containing protein n=2 Tax=Segnochrobactrum spirostomi TaxID=2608987 RepID=A0A6A7XZL6_9HYPH|nr:CYTH domain-containing protein [Segnochrobactrum spirostomi]